MIPTRSQSPETTTATPLCCIECARPWDVAGERWRLKVLVEEGQAPEPVPYCPDCHEREFGV